MLASQSPPRLCFTGGKRPREVGSPRTGAGFMCAGVQPGEATALLVRCRLPAKGQQRGAGGAGHVLAEGWPAAHDTEQLTPSWAPRTRGLPRVDVGARALGTGGRQQQWVCGRESSAPWPRVGKACWAVAAGTRLSVLWGAACSHSGSRGRPCPRACGPHVGWGGLGGHLGPPCGLQTSQWGTRCWGRFCRGEQPCKQPSGTSRGRRSPEGRFLPPRAPWQPPSTAPARALRGQGYSSCPRVTAEFPSARGRALAIGKPRSLGEETANCADALSGRKNKVLPLAHK